MKRSLTAWVLLAIASGGALGCHGRRDTSAEHRRALLKPVDAKHDVEELRQKQQVFSDDGMLLPSDQVVAGVVLPRGLQLYAKSDHDWDFKAMHVEIGKLERYFRERLRASGVEHSLGGSVTFTQAYPKDDPSAPPVQLRIVKLSGAYDASEIFIHEAVPGKLRPSGAEAEAQLQARRAHAD